MPESDVDLQERAYSNNYIDLIISFQGTESSLLQNYPFLGVQPLGGGYAILHVDKQYFTQNISEGVGYNTIPKLFATLDTTSLEASGILRAQNQPVLNLKGEGVLLGFVDTGINYTLNAFRSSDGFSRILGIWDQTIPNENPPAGLGFGTVYTKEDLNQALSLEEPYSLVPTRDENGHGTFVAGVAAGSDDPANNFIGAAPRCEIAMVKLKEAKPYLKNFFFVPESALAYSEADIMLGIYYLYQLSLSSNLPLVICIGLGTNQGDHAGNTFLESLLAYYSKYTGIYSVVAAGNEAGKSHHFYGKINRQNEYQNVEILVDKETKGFTVELWAQAPELYSISITSPLGETIPAVPARMGQSTVANFILENTVIYIDYMIVELVSGSQLILVRFSEPTPGLWVIGVVNNIYINGNFNMWLPVTGLIEPGTVFLSPNPDTTLTAPSNTDAVITVSTYNAYDNSLFINSSRGYTRTGDIKPDLAAPGVNVYGPVDQNRYGTRTGSSLAAAITAGSVALLVNWGLKSPLPHILTSNEVENFLIRGAKRSSSLLYPNREWGYGTLDLYGVFESLR